MYRGIIIAILLISFSSGAYVIKNVRIVKSAEELKEDCLGVIEELQGTFELSFLAAQLVCFIDNQTKGYEKENKKMQKEIDLEIKKLAGKFLKEGREILVKKLQDRQSELEKNEM